MQKAFKITDQNADLYRKYVAKIEAQETYREEARKFIDNHGFKQHYCLLERLTVDMEPEKAEELKTQLMKERLYGLYRFKKNSTIQKEFEKDVISHVDMRALYSLSHWGFNHVVCGGRIRQELWLYDDVLYGKIEANGEINLADFMEEIPMSEYYRIIEELEVKQ